MARISSTPGKTRQLNFFAINQGFYLVDLPGYGFAKVSKSEKRKWQQLIEQYILTSQQLRCVVSIVDARHGPTQSDIELIEWLAENDIRCLVVATKVDKLNRKQRNEATKRITQVIEQLPVDGPIFFSSESGEGKQELWRSLTLFLET